ncbi:MAG: sugar kinase [Micrococcales bacterium]|nr:sugar kinase [Micrococcales bacterium]
MHCSRSGEKRRHGCTTVPTRLICLGNVVIDITARVAALPRRGDDIIAESGAMLAGGSGFNVMTAAARLGTHTLYAGTHGTGPAGELARKALHDEGIAIAHEPEPDIDTGWDIALTDAGAERTFVTVVGAEGHLTSRHLSTVSAAPGDTVYVSGYGLLAEPNRGAIIDWLAALPAQVTVVTDPGPLVGTIDPQSMSAVRQATTWWSCNDREATALTGIAHPRDAAKVLASSGMGVVVRLGAEGCLLTAPGNDPVALPGFAMDAVDTNGAGDAHVGAYIAHLLGGFAPTEAARRANAAAAIAITRFGPATAPRTDELDHFLGRPTVK